MKTSKYVNAWGRFFMIIILLLNSVLFASCGNPLDKVVDQLDLAIKILESQSASWQQVLDETTDKILEEGQETIANEVDRVLQRAVIASGTQVLCIIDHLRIAVREDLIRIKVDVLNDINGTNEPIPPLIPYICGWDPPTLNYDWIKDGSETEMVINGYNFDPKDPPRLYIVNEPDSAFVEAIPITPPIISGNPPQFNKIIEKPLSLAKKRISSLEMVEAGNATVGSHYEMTVDLTDLPLTPESEFLYIQFSNNENWQYAITHPTQPGPPPPVFAAGSINFYLYGPLAQGKTDTGIPETDYDCGIVGLFADWGDIDEYDRKDILVARAYTEAGTWRIHVDFSTLEYELLGETLGAHETWRVVSLMCIRTEYRNTGYLLFKGVDVSIYDGSIHTKNLDIATDQYYCGIVGMSARYGDIAENGSQEKILAAYVDDNAGNWTVKTEFATQKDRDETWNVDVLCVIRDDDLFLWKRFDNLESDGYYDTNILVEDYACGIVGMQALYGDINENDAGEILIVLATNPFDHWMISTNFRTHEDDESWIVDLLCVRNTIATYSFRPWSP